MPIYEYECPGCGRESEYLQKMDAPPPPCEEEGCPEKGSPLTRKVSRTSFELVGGGWAKDGYGG